MNPYFVNHGNNKDHDVKMLNAESSQSLHCLESPMIKSLQIQHNEIDRISLHLMSPDDIKQRSVVQITESSIHYKHLPRPHGINDYRMGTVDRRIPCGTCGNTLEKCNGHWGHMNLSAPVFHAGYLSEINALLNSLCFFCSRYRISHYIVDRKKKTKKSILQTTDQKDINQKQSVDKKQKLNPKIVLIIREKHRDRFKEIAKLASKVSACFHCGAPCPKYKKTGMNINMTWTSKQLDEMQSDEERYIASAPFTPYVAWSIVSSMDRKDIKLMGFNPKLIHPKYFFITTLAVPPPIIRPSISASEGSKVKGQNELTRKLQEIMRFSTLLKQELETWKQEQKNNNDSDDGCSDGDDDDDKKQNICATQNLLESQDYFDSRAQEFYQKLQYHVCTYMNNDMSGIKQDTSRSGAPIKCLFTRIKGKDGRIRHNLMGKRVEFSARCVVSPDSNMDIDELGVPKHVALTLTVPERVNHLNRHKLRRRVICGPGRLDGAANIIRKKTGVQLNLEYVKNRHKIQLYDGDIIERYLKNGDYVVFNRQPSLHKQSLMGHRVKIMHKGNTFRLNLSCCGPYNADFDGDEMNMHVVQSEQARAEVKEIMAVPHQILDPKSNKPCMGLVQDALVGSYYLSRKDTFLTREHMMNLLMWIHYNSNSDDDKDLYCPKLPPPAIWKPKPLWTGKQLYSIIIPSGIDLVKYSRGMDKHAPLMSDYEEKCVIIQDGQLITGALCKQTVGTSSGGLIHLICKDKNPNYASRFLSDAQRIVNQWLTSFGFSVGIKDCMAREDTKQEISQTVQGLEQRVKKIYECAASQHMKPSDVEQHITQLLSKSVDRAGRRVKSEMGDNNRLYGMTQSGSKGNIINISQIMACVGQQSICGQRISSSSRDRTLPCFKVQDLSAVSRGFVKNSFTQGLSPQEFFFCAMGGREGLVDTAVKTADTGYIQRRLGKALEGMKTYHDGSVRNAEGYIVMPLYGGDGMDATYLEKCTLKLLSMSDMQIRKMVYGDNDLFHYSATTISLLDQQIDDMIKLRDLIRTYKITLLQQEMNQTIYSPCNIQRTIKNIQRMMTTSSLHSPQITTLPIDENKINDLIEYICNAINDVCEKTKSCVFLTALIRFDLCPTKLIHHHKFHHTKWIKMLIDMIHFQYEKCRVSAGEMVGPIAAQSNGSVATQMTLNTFHLSGVGSKIVNMGVPRLRELIDVTKRMKTPSLTLFLRQPLNQNEDYARVFARTLIHTDLGDVVQSSSLVWEPVPLETKLQPDLTIVELYRPFVTTFIEKHRRTLCRWVIRLELDHRIITKRTLDCRTIFNKVKQAIGSRGYVMASEPNMKKWILRIRLIDVRAMGEKASKTAVASSASTTTTTATKDDRAVQAERLIARTVMIHLTKHVKLGGYSTVKDASCRRINRSIVDSKTKSITNMNEYVIDTQGNGLQDVWKSDAIDWARSYSNDLHETVKTLGINVASVVLFHEIKNVMSCDSTYIDDRHIMMIVSAMTFRGYLMPISRHGINRIDTGFTVKASFEEPMDILTRAAVDQETDHLRGVTENIMTGQLIPSGVGDVHVYTDPAYTKQCEEKERIHTRKRKSNVLCTSTVQHNVHNYNKRYRRQDGTSTRILRSVITSWGNIENLHNFNGTLEEWGPPSPVIKPRWDKDDHSSVTSLLLSSSSSNYNSDSKTHNTDHMILKLPPPNINTDKYNDSKGSSDEQLSSSTSLSQSQTQSPCPMKHPYRPSSPKFDIEACTTTESLRKTTLYRPSSPHVDIKLNSSLGSSDPATFSHEFIQDIDMVSNALQGIESLQPQHQPPSPSPSPQPPTTSKSISELLNNIDMSNIL